MPLLQNNTVYAVLILQLSAVAEIENPGLSEFNIHAFSAIPGSLGPEGQIKPLLRVGSVQRTTLMYFILTLPQSNVIRETT